MNQAWFASRYDRGTPDYINCAMNRGAVPGLHAGSWSNAEEAPVHGFEDKQRL